MMHPPPAGAAANAVAQRLTRLAGIAAAHEIRPDWVDKLRQIEEFDVVALCDDSGSMATAAAGGGAGGGAGGPFAPRATRWTELRQTVSIVVDLATSLSDAGVDVRFARPRRRRARASPRAC